MNYDKLPVSMIMLETMQTERDGKASLIAKTLEEAGFVRDRHFRSWSNVNQLWINRNHSESWILDILDSTNKIIDN